MKGNLLLDKKFLFLYVGFWALSSLAWTAALVYYHGLPFFQGLTDGFLSQSLLYLLLLPVWFVVRYGRKTGPKKADWLVNAFAALLFVVLSWMALSEFFLSAWLGNDPAYARFLAGSKAARAGLGILNSLLVGLGFFSVQLLSDTREAARRESELQQLLQETELRSLKNQLNPHFLYNSLNAISSLVGSQPEQARQAIIRLSDFLRLALRQDPLGMSSLKEELENMQRYLAIEEARFGEKIPVSLNLDEDVLNLPLPALILQPLVENALKHGEKDPELKLVAGNHKHRLHLCLSNAYDPNWQHFSSEGLGLQNIRDRLRLLYGNSRLMQIKTTEGRFEVCLDIPVKAVEKSNE